MVMVSPLHRVITAARWDAERLLGRLIVLVHATFLDAGFVPLPRDPLSRSPGTTVPSQAGRTASSLSLRYTAPHRPDDAEVAAAQRLLAHGRRHLILHVKCDRWPVERCVVLDALAAAPLLSGGLHATARALRRVAALAALWRRVSDDLGRRALVDVCARGGGVALESTFMSLPGDAKAAVLSRLADGADLTSVERVCTGLRRLVVERDRQLWKPRYDALARRAASCGWFVPEVDCCRSPEEMRWKERYVMARRWKLPESPLGTPCGYTEVIGYCYEYQYNYFVPPFCYKFCNIYRPRRVADRDDDDSEPEADAVADRRWYRIAIGRASRSPPSFVRENRRRRGAGAIHAPSSRFRWKHR